MKSTSPLPGNSLQSGGKMGALMRQYHWCGTSLGNPDQWPQSLLTTLRTLLHSCHPVALFWGEEYILFYNDAFQSSYLKATPGSERVSGQSAAQVWPDHWTRLKPALDRVLRCGEGFTDQVQLLPVSLTSHWTYSCSPVFDESDMPVGVLLTCIGTARPGNRSTHKGECQVSERYRLILDSLHASIAILDRQGNIVMVNEVWRSYGSESKGQTNDFVGTNYLEVCRRSNIQEGIQIADGIEKVLRAELEEYSLDYAGYEPGRWYRARVTPIVIQGAVCEVTVMHLDITDRKTAELQMKKALLEKQKILDVSQDVICAFDVDGRFVQVNGACNRVWGYEPEELLGVCYLELLYKEDHEKTIRAAARRIKGEESTYFENRYVHKDGRLVPMTWSAYWDAHEQVLYCTARDITKRKKAEEQLLAFSAKVSTVLESITDGFYTINHEWVVTYWNKEAEHLLGYSREEAVGKCIWDIFPEALSPTPYQEFQRAFAERVSVQFEQFSTFRSRWLDISAYPLEDGLSVFFKDITTRKQASEEIRAAKERYDIVTKATHDAIWDWDLCTNELHWTGGFEELFGYNKSEDPHSIYSWFSLIHPEDQKSVKSSLNVALHSSDTEQWQSTYRFTRADGSLAYVLDRGYIIRDKRGKPVRMIGAMQDVTIQKEHEMEREDLIRELSSSYQELKQFSYITSHNFRAPLSNLIGLLNLMRDIPLEDPLLKEIFQGFKVSTLALNETVEDLINILIIKENPSRSKRKIRLRDIYTKVTGQIRNMIVQANADIQFDESEAPVVIFDQSYLESIFLNLLTNAIKFRSLHRDLIITITTQDAGGSVRMIFKDNGIGMDMERYRDRIFGLYQCFHARPDSKGLGLYLIKSQVVALGGSIEVESQVDVGTTFTLTFRK